MQTMTRAEAVDKLMGRYAGYFDISPAEEEQAPLVATCDFHALSENMCSAARQSSGSQQPRICVPVFRAAPDGGNIQLLSGLCL